MDKLIIEKDLCDGCLDCVNSCASIHKSPGINIIELDSKYYPIVCQHCDDAPCEKVCPTDAINDEGVNQNKCIGCRLCETFCPFGAITISNRVVGKCNLCSEREEGPACIKACSKRAISKMDIDKMKLDKQRKYLSKLSESKGGVEIMNLITLESKASKPKDE